MTKPWPAWASRWYGVVLRFLVALCGLVFGLYLMLGGYYTAVDWKTGESNWTAGAVFLIVAGVVLTAYSLWGAIRPSKLSFLPPTVFFLGVVVFSVIAVMEGLWRGPAT